MVWVPLLRLVGGASSGGERMDCKGLYGICAEDQNIEASGPTKEWQYSDSDSLLPEKEWNEGVTPVLHPQRKQLSRPAHF